MTNMEEPGDPRIGSAGGLMNWVPEIVGLGVRELVLRRGAGDATAGPLLRSGGLVVCWFGTRERVPFRGVGETTRNCSFPLIA